MMSRARNFSIVLVVVLTLFTGMGSALGAQEGIQPKYLKIATSTMGGVWFPVAAALAEVINANVEGTIATATLGAADKNVLNVENGKIFMGFTTSDSAAAAMTMARKPFKKKVQNVRALARIYATPIQIAVWADSPIKSVKDFEGKRVNAFKRGGSLEKTFSNILKEYGVTYDSIRKAGGTVSHVGYSEEIMQMKDKLMDVAIFMTPAPSSQIMDLETKAKIRLIPVDEWVLDKLMKKFPGYSKTVIPANAYKGQTEPVPAVAVSHIIVVSDQLSEDFVYQMTKAIYGNLKAIRTVHPVVKRQMTLEKAPEGVVLPLHPGAEKFYREKGILK